MDHPRHAVDLYETPPEFFGRTSYHDHEGIALDLDERDRLVRDLGDNNAMILRHHGLLTTGRTVGDTFYEMYYLEQARRLEAAATHAARRWWCRRTR